MKKPPLSLLALGLLVLGLLTSACSSAAPTLTAAELMADPEAYVDVTVELTGSPLDYGYAVNAAACDAPGPCNNLGGPHRLAGTDVFVAPSASFPSDGPVAEGVSPQPCYDAICEPRRLGCHGNDAEAFCAPDLPMNIERVVARLTRVDGRLQLEVDDYVLAETRVAADGIHLPAE